MTSWWRCRKACTFDTDVAGSAELLHGQPEEWLPTEKVKSSWRWLGRRNPERDTCNTDILLGRVPTAGLLYNASIVHFTKSQVHNCHTASTAGLCGKYLYWSTFGKCDPGQCDRVPTMTFDVPNDADRPDPQGSLLVCL
jgi:hypothetical protein